MAQKIPTIQIINAVKAAARAIFPVSRGETNLSGGTGLFSLSRFSSLANVPLSRFSNIEDGLSAYTAVASVYSCVNRIATYISSIEPEFVNQKGEVEFTLYGENNEITTILKQPNPYQSYSEWIETVVAHLELAGNGVNLMENMNGLGQPDAIYPFIPAFVRLYADPVEGLLGYVYQPPSGGRVVANPDEILHFKYANPLSLFSGQSTIAALFATLDTELNIADSIRALFGNAAIPAGAFVTDQTLTDPQYKRMKAEFEQENTGVVNFFKPLLLEGGVKWQAMTMNMTDLGTIDLRKYTRDEIFMGFGVPVSEAGNQGSANVKNDHLTEVFKRNTIAPKTRRIENTLQKLVDRYDKNLTVKIPVPEFVDVSELLNNALKIDRLTSLSVKEKRVAIKTVAGKNIGLAQIPDEMEQPPIPPSGTGTPALPGPGGMPALPATQGAAPATQTGGNIVDMTGEASEDSQTNKQPKNGKKDDTQEYFDTACIMFYLPADAAKTLALKIPEAEKPEDLHLTLCFLGEVNKLSCTFEELKATVMLYAGKKQPVTGSISGFGVFNSDHGEGSVLYASVDAPSLPDFRQGLVDALLQSKIQIERSHGFTPHITLAYLKSGNLPVFNPLLNLEITFDGITLAWGENYTTIPLRQIEHGEFNKADKPVIQGNPIEWNDSQLEQLAEINPADTQRAQEFWRLNAPQGIENLLDATIETGKKSLTPDYRWDEKSQRYKNLTTGKFVSRKQILAALETTIEASQKNISDVSARLVEGRASLPFWQMEMTKQIKTLHLCEAALARGGWAQLTQADYGRVGQALKTQYQYLQEFAKQIGDGTQAPGGIEARAQLYAGSARATFYSVEKIVKKEAGLTKEKWVLHPGENCPGCKAQSEKGWQPIGSLPVIGSQKCLTNCKCSIEYE